MIDDEPKTVISIDSEDHILEEMTAEQQTLIRHLTDLDQKILQANFNLQQLQVSRDAFFTMLKSTLSEAHGA